MKESDIKDWCWDVWPKHWKELAPSSNSRALFVKETIKLVPDEDELKSIELAIIAQTKHWRSKSRIEKVYGIPRLSQWIKDRRFDDEFIDESATSIQERAKMADCIHCGQPVHGPRYRECVDHVMQHHGDRLGKAKQANLRKQVLQDLNLLEPGQTLQQLAAKCREYLRNNKKSFNQLVKYED